MIRFRRVLTLVAAVALTGCHQRAEEPQAEEPRVSGAVVSLAENSPQLASFQVEPATTAKPSALELNGRISWDEDATVRIYSAFGGRVTRIHAQVGDHVKRGDVLAELASPDYGQAEADAHKATSDLRLAERTMAREKDLFDHGAAPRRELEAAEADLERARAEHERAEARLSAYGGHDRASVDGSFALRSPIDGEVVERSLTPGQEVRPDQMLAGTAALTAPMFTVTDPTHLWVVMDVNEHDASALSPGQSCVVRPHLKGGLTLPGTIALVSQYLDPTSLTVKARATVANPDRALRAEMLVSVGVDAPADKLVEEVPARAVFLSGDKHYVYVASGGGHFARTAVDVGREHDGLLQVDSGIGQGDSVVVGGTLLLEKLYREHATGL
ncbi:MAG TPA: efflux RND transporter periplasmic adaptor subunit [Myxococcota bacterium]|nr:efflux RND transporter periplasmic adaptor subunit [Myxococcota bacterium]